MLLHLYPLRRTNLLMRWLHTGKQFTNPSTEDIIFNAICVNLRQRKWKSLEQMSMSLKSSTVHRVICKFQYSPELVLEFYKRTGWCKCVEYSLESYCTIIHVMVNYNKYDDALCLMKELMMQKGYSSMEVLKGLIACNGDIDFTRYSVFDTLVRACTQIGATEAAYNVIMTFKMEGGGVSIHAWNNFLNHLVKLNEIAKFWNVYREMISCGYYENINTYNLLAFTFCKECKLYEAIAVFYRMLKHGFVPNFVSFNMLIDGACRIGNIDLALKLVGKMGIMSGGIVTPNLITYNCLINGYCKAGGAAAGEEMLNEMIKVGIRPNVRTYATLIDGYSRIGCLEEAFRLCDAMWSRGLAPNSVLYNSIIHWLYMEGDKETATLLLSNMIKGNIFPDKFTFSIVAKGLYRNGYINEALKYHKLFIENNHVEDSFLYNIIIDCLCKRKDITGALQLVANMFVQGLVPDLVTYGTLIDGCCKSGNLGNALQVYDDIEKADKPSNLVIYNSIVHGLCKESVDLAASMIDELQNAGLGDVITYNTLLHGYCDIGKLDKALKLYLRMKKEGITVNNVTHNILIDFMCKLGLIEQAEQLMKKMMIARGVTPDFITYKMFLTNVRKNCNAEKVIELHDFMVLNGVIPDKDTYKLIVCPLLEETGSV